METEFIKRNRLKMKSKDKAMNKDEVEISIRFVTKQQRYSIQNCSLLVHGSIDTNELNTIINKFLKESNDIQDQVEFDFLICSQFLRSSLSEHIAERGISAGEEVIDVEYIEKYPSPEPKDCLIHDDWVSAVAVCGKWILTGCYDNTLHIWTSEGKHHLVISGHTSPIKAIAWISFNDDTASFISGSMDQTCMIWNWDITENSVECVHVCKGHRRSIEAVSVNYDKTLIATGAWDSMLYIWSTYMQEKDDGESASKRTKPEYTNKTKTPKCAMKGHKQAVSGVVWSDKTEIITGSWDHTIKTWDTELNGIKQEIHGDKSFFDVDYSPLSRAVIAGSADQHVRLFDPRSTEGAIVKTRFTSHTQWVVSVRWSTVDEHLFISGAYDNIIKFWDTRSPKAPLFDLLGHEDKVLSCDWSNPKFIVSGGADNTLRIFKSKHVEH